jgi:flagellar hook assembly protein FlgD
VYKNGGNVKLSARLATNNFFRNVKNISWNGKNIGVDSASFGNVAAFSANLNLDQLASKNSFAFNTTTQGALNSLSSLVLNYPRIPNFDDLPFSLMSTNAGPRYFDLQGLPNEITTVYDIQNNQKISLFVLNASIKRVIAQANSNLVIAKSVKEIDKVEVRSFFDYSKKNGTYLFIANKKLLENLNGQRNALQEYVDYRKSASGGAFNTALIYTDEIYDQFGFGLPNHMWAYKNLTHYLKKNWPNLEFVNLIGKGVEYHYTRTKTQLNSNTGELLMIPTFGTSPSDVLLFSPGKQAYSYFALGRLAVRNMNDLSIYLDKVKAHDASINAPQTKEKIWLKKIVHLGGGGEPGEQASIKSYLDRMGDIIGGGKFGGKANGYFKTSASSVQIANLDGIYRDINSGAAMITFFGHASVGTFDFNLDNPANYNNTGRYPFIFSLGCYSGNIHTPSKGISEDFLFTKDKGAIAFVAAAGTAYLYTQGEYGLEFYNKVATDGYGKSLGKVINEFGVKYKDQFDPAVFTLYQQLVYHGDPATKIHGFEKPDLAVDFESLSAGSIDIFEDQDSFSINYKVLNIGQSIKDSFMVDIVHLSPLGDTVSTSQVWANLPPHSMTNTLKLPLKVGIAGVNKIYITLDKGNRISELDESNNEARSSTGSKGYDFVILSNEIKATYPYENSIYTGASELELVASSVNAAGENTDYIIQVDQVPTFDSPALKEERFIATAPFIAWKPNLALKDKQVYYWRVSPIPTGDKKYVWSNSNFTYMKDGEEGFRQSDYGQWATGSSSTMKVGKDNKWEYLKDSVIVQVKSEVFTGERPQSTVNGSKWGSLTPFGGNSNLLNIVVWDSKTILFNKGSDYNTVPWERDIFCFDLSSSKSRKGVADLLADAPEEAVIIAYLYLTTDTTSFNTTNWGDDKSINGFTLYETLNKYGSEYFESIKSNGLRPYIFTFTKKNGKIHEKIGINLDDRLSQITITPSNKNPGVYLSNKIGPSNNFKKLKLNFQNLIGGNNETFYRIYKLDSSLANKVLVADKMQEQLIDLQKYQLDKDYITIEFYTSTSDWLGQIPAQLYNWEVNFVPLPDYMLNNVSFVKNTTEQGEPIKLNYKVYNNTNKKVDSLNYVFQVKNNQNKTVLQKGTISNIQPKTTSFELSYNDIDLKGNAQFSLTINPEGKPKEKNTFNNVAYTSKEITIDKSNPKLSVFFDGIKIMDGDIVSKSAMIKVEVADENKFLKIIDPSSLTVGILSEKTGKIIYYDPNTSKDVKFIAQNDNSNNRAFYEIRSQLEDGKYTIYANGKDQIGNSAGKEAYQVNFEVSSEARLSKLTNYPNPFSDRTNFVFQLTGKVPDKMKLRVYTITGKVVKEFTKEELGNIKIGKNMTSLSWDGTDEYGSKLGNGVYLMKMTCEDSEIKFDANLTDDFMQNGFSKIVILR